MQQRIVVLTPEEVSRLMEMARSDYRPDEIRRMRALIAHETEICEAREQKTGKVDHGHMLEIAAMNLELNTLYNGWINRTIF